MKTTWNENVSIRIPLIDKEHKQLMRILEQIEEHQHDNVGSEAISTVIDQLREFASSHFRHEEDYMHQVGFPGYQAHKEQHKRFRERTAAFCVDVMNQKDTTPQEIYHYLSDWVANHVLDSDKKLQAFLEARQSHDNTE